MPSIKKNFLYNGALTAANYLFPLIVYPYTFRVLGVHNIGICNFVDSIISYFILFSMMGIGTFGIREMAKYNDDFKLRSKAFSSIILLNTISTFIVLVVLFVLTFTVDKLAQYKDMMLIGGLKILFNYLLIEWLYRGLENFKYITIRTVIVKILYVFSVFLFVKESDDYVIFYLLSGLMVAINALVNINYSKKFVTFSFKDIDIKQYVRPFFILGVYNFLTSLYLSFNVLYLGFVSGETEVGYYTTATKIHTVLLALYTAFTSVMLPRLSNMASKGDVESIKRMCDKSVDILLIFSLPIVFFSIIFASHIIKIIAGVGYENAILPMQIVMPLLFIIGYEQIIVIQILTSMKYDKAVLINSSLGALIALIANMILVPRYQSIGSAIVWLICEITVLLSAQYFSKKYIQFKFPLKQISTHLLAAIPIVILLIIISKIPMNYILNFMLGAGVCAIYYGVLLVKGLCPSWIRIQIQQKLLNIKKKN